MSVPSKMVSQFCEATLHGGIMKPKFVVLFWHFDSERVPQLVVSCECCRQNMTFPFGGVIYDVLRWMNEHKCPKTTLMGTFGSIKELLY
jgi:hypothetical protein